MNAFAAAMDRIFANATMAVDAYWISSALSEEHAIRVIRRAPDEISSFGSARILSDTTTVDVLVSELANPRPDDLILFGTEGFVIQGEPVRDRERLIWTLDLRPA
ncbi:MAG: head-tail joining protein [Alphaproteobacteria bacterium]